MIFYHGHGLGRHSPISASIQPNFEQAAKWFRKAAEQGLSCAQFNLGWMCSGGEGGLGGRQEAVAWFKRAALQGHTDAQVMLGHFYCEGIMDGASVVIPKSFAEAYYWYWIAGSAGHPVANSNCLDICEYRMKPEEVASTKRRAQQFSPQIPVCPVRRS